jgi:thiosulfate dehydrogenase [quinone] large subunit
MHRVAHWNHHVADDPPFVHALFNTTRYAWVWLPIRLFLAYQWLNSGFGKLTNPGWMETGASLQGYWTNALRVDPRPVITYDWYRSFIQLLVDTNAHVWFSKIVVFGELAVGLGLLLGAFTGIAAFGGTLLNINFLLAGTTSTNPVLYTLAIVLMLSWKVCGYYGLDRFLLPRVGVPWRPSAPSENRSPDLARDRPSG